MVICYGINRKLIHEPWRGPMTDRHLRLQEEPLLKYRKNSQGVWALYQICMVLLFHVLWFTVPVIGGSKIQPGPTKEEVL